MSEDSRRIDEHNNRDRSKINRSEKTASVESQWRNIETAPRDGTKFWAFERRRGQYECWYHTDGYWMDHADSEPGPTHWMPLPAPPHGASDVRRG